MITLFQFEISPYCDKIRRILHWKRQPYRVEEIPLSQAFTRVRKLNPRGKLPCLEHDGRVICDSTDIAYYLEEQFPDPPLIPKDPRLRGLCHLLEDWADESLYFYEMRLRFTLPHNARRFIPALTKYDPGWMKTAARYFVPRMMRGVLSRQGLGRKPLDQVLGDVERHVGAIQDWLGGRDWLVGDALSLADLGVFSQLTCIRGADEGARIIERMGPVAEWMERVDRATARPG
jgi:glutathione S-transferase